MTQDSPSRRQDQFVVRLPDGMRDRLRAEAEANKRSMNAEIIARLERTLVSDDTVASAVANAPDGAADDMEAAALKFFEAIKMARTHGGRISLQIDVDGIDNQELQDEIGVSAFDAIRMGGPARREDTEETG